MDGKRRQKIRREIALKRSSIDRNCKVEHRSEKWVRSMGG